MEWLASVWSSLYHRHDNFHASTPNEYSISKLSQKDTRHPVGDGFKKNIQYNVSSITLLKT